MFHTEIISEYKQEASVGGRLASSKVGDLFTFLTFMSESVT